MNILVMQITSNYILVRFTVMKSLKRGVPLLPHMTTYTAKVHKLMEFDKVKFEQSTEVPAVAFGHLIMIRLALRV